MTAHYAALSHHALGTGSAYARPAEPVELVHLDDSALDVFTDFRSREPITVEPDRAIAEALAKMKWTGVRLLLVTDTERRVVGLISSRDIEGEKPVRFSQATGQPHDRIRVQDIMTPQAGIQVLNWNRVRDAQVGHIVATLREAGRHHLLVAETAADGAQCILGLFSASQISRQLGWEITDVMTPAASLAEMLTSA